MTNSISSVLMLLRQRGEFASRIWSFSGLLLDDNRLILLLIIEQTFTSNYHVIAIN